MLIIILLLILVFAQGAAAAAAPTSIVVQPAWFGKSWGDSAVNATVRIVDIDLCNETLIMMMNQNLEKANNNTTTTAIRTIDPSSSKSDPRNLTAILFDAVEWNSLCTFADMAQAAENAFPSADILLISRVVFLGMAQEEGELDTSLSMATITLEDTLAIKTSLINNNSNSNATDDGVLVNIDGVSRCLVDICNCKEDDTDDPVECWSLALRISSIFSTLGSAYIIWSLSSTQKKRSENLKLLFNRLLIALCVCDILSSVGMFIGRWAYSSKPPGEYEGIFSEELWLIQRPGAKGTRNTCRAEGFLIHLGLIGGALFTSFLAIHTLLYVRYGWRSEKLKKAERAFFSIGIGVPLIGASIALYMNLFNEFDLGFCWLTKPLSLCEYVVDSDEDPGGSLLDEWCEDVYDISGKLFLYQIGLGIMWSLLALCTCLYCMMSLYFHVRRQEVRSARWVLTASQGQHQKVVLARAFMYLLVFVLVWFPSIIALVLRTDSLSYVITTLTPLQGCLNAMISSGYIEKWFFRKPTASDFERSSSTYEVPKDQPDAKRFSVLTKIGAPDVVDDGT